MASSSSAAYGATVPPGFFTAGLVDESVLKGHLTSVPAPGVPYDDVIFLDEVERSLWYSNWLVYYNNVLLIMASKYNGPNKHTYLQQYIACVQRAAANSAGNPIPPTGSPTRKEDKPKPPALTPCDIFCPHVDTYLKSVQLYLYNFKLSSDIEVAMVYVNNLTEASKSHLYNIHPLSETAFYSSANVIAFIEQFTNKTEK
eukprot:8251315-Pyramimonas_sp.AAC.1